MDWPFPEARCDVSVPLASLAVIRWCRCCFCVHLRANVARLRNLRPLLDRPMNPTHRPLGSNPTLGPGAASFCR